MQRLKENTIYPQVLIHFGFWLLIMNLPLFWSQQPLEFSRIMKHNWMPIFLFSTLFYVNYLWLLDTYFYNNKRKTYILINFLFIAITGSLGHILFELSLPVDHIRPPDPFPSIGPGGSPAMYAIKDSLLLLTPILLSIALKSTERSRTFEKEQKEIETKNLQTELQGLKYQLKPHFFFNSLNNIYSLIEVSPSDAQKLVHSLSKLMRYLLYDAARDKVLLSQEILFLEKYIALMEFRLSKTTDIKYSFPQIELITDYVSPLLFLSIVENAFKHGVSSTQKSIISFIMESKNNMVYFESKNSNYPKNEADESGSGIGADNLKKRLELLYPNKHTLTSKVVDDFYIVSLRIDLTV